MVSSMLVALVAIFVAAVLWSVVSSQRRRRNLLPGPRGWPVIGSLGALAALAARHGQLMHLRLVSYHVVVASSADAARLVLKTHDLAFADRPRTAAGEIASYGYLGIVHTPYRPYWRMARKLCATELFSARRVDQFECVRGQEMRVLPRGLFGRARAGEAIHVREHLAGLTLRNILRMAVGEKWSGSAEGEAFRGALDEAFAVSGAVGNVGEWLPWLGWIDVQGYNRRMKALRETFDRFYEQILDEHEARVAGAGEEFVARDLVDVLLQLVDGDADGAEARLTRDSVKALIQDVISGGDHGVGDDGAPPPAGRHGGRGGGAGPRGGTRAVGDGARPAGPPLRRRRGQGDAAAAPGGPAAGPAPRARGRGGWRVRRPRRRARAGQRVGRGPRPGVVARRARHVPAGAVPPRRRRRRRGRARGALRAAAGRRMCQAYGLALKVLAAGVATLVQRFEWRLPDGVAPEDVSMEEHIGLSTRRKEPLVAVAEPRLPARLYVAAAAEE